MADPEEWAIDSNEAVEISLLGPLASNPLQFHPDYTYPIFGDTETIYGYKGLAINLLFARWDMRGSVKINWDRKINPNLGVEAEDILETLKEYLPEGIVQALTLTLDFLYDENDFELHLANPSFDPPGEKIESYTVNSNLYTVYRSTLKDPNTFALAVRLQIFVLLFIEGGSYIEISDDKWNIYTLFASSGHANSRYEKKPDQVPTLAGYATIYPYHYHEKGFPTANDTIFYDSIFKSSSDEAGPTTCRLRLSQFLILPPFQRAGHGGKFYDIILKYARADPDVLEIGVEDPSDAFEDLRDRRDLQFLEGLGVFKDVEAPVSKSWIETMRKKYKMPPVCYFCVN
jgi:histone acetyltransferase 1